MKGMTRSKRRSRLLEALAHRVLVLDGAMGTAIQNQALGAKAFGGEEQVGCNEALNLFSPDVIEGIHKSYLEVGADIIETNTFGATPLVLAEFHLAEKTLAINRAAAELARKCADAYSTPNQPRFVAGSIGPTTKAITVTGGISFEELVEQFYQQARGLYEGEVDYFLLETCQDTRNVKAGLLGIWRLLEEKKDPVPIAVSCTIEPMGTMLAGQTIDAFAASLEHADLLYVGLNCATGPEFMTDHVRTLASLCRTRVACVPNAGLPDEEGRYLETPEMMARILEGFGRQGWINLLGGCCGTRPAHIRAFVGVARTLQPRKPLERVVSGLSGIEYFEVSEEKRPILVGERTNVIGSKKFKSLIEEERYLEASEMARVQVKEGAHLVDLCMANPDRDELRDMEAFMKCVIHKVRVPFVLDTTDAQVMETALKYCQGKSLLNSINLEEGEKRFNEVVPLAKKYGAALVVGCIDEDPENGMAVTGRRKLEIAERSFAILTGKHGIHPADLYFDALVFPCGTGDAKYRQSAPETLEGVRLIKERFPQSKTILGISNVSFGLPLHGREVLNAVFLYHCVKSGLDLAIVNTEKLERYASLPEQERALAEHLLWNRPQALEAFTEYFRQSTPKTKSKDSLPLHERLAQYIVEGTQEGLVSDLDLALQAMKPLEIINGPLMRGMEEVGRLFNRNELIVAEVLQSAQAMKAAVSHLERFMEKGDVSTKGRVILATVKGDVHDIGKNLVEIILKNNGFDVVNLGIKVPPEQILAAVREHQPQIIGLSGLLVRSAQQMVVTAQDLRQAGVNLPLLVGGAALSQSFVDKKIAPEYVGFVEYAKDAMEGLDLARDIGEPENFTKRKDRAKGRREAKPEGADSRRTDLPAPARTRKVKISAEPPKAPDFERHVLQTPPDQLWPFINPLMLYGRHLGIKGGVVRKVLAGERDAKDRELKKAWEIFAVVEEVKEFCRREGMQPKAIYQFWSATAEGNQVQVFRDPKELNPFEVFEFPRQKEGLSLADFVAPRSASGEAVDNLCCFVVTAGEGILAQSADFKEKGEYLKSHALQALALETAEAFAEFLHTKIRAFWGFPDPPTLTMMERFQAKYRGKRYSFGYPACPNLADQTKLFRMLDPLTIGVSLTEGFMMDPEASVSALVFHHPEAIYFAA